MIPVHAEPIGTERLALLPLRAEDADAMAVVLSDPALHTFIGGSPATVEELRARYLRMVAGSPDPAVSWCNWIISSAGSPAGYVQATVVKDGGGDLTAEIAWVVGTPWQGRGIAKEAARGLVRWLEGQGVRTVLAHVHPEHGASAAVARAAGLTPTDERHDGEVRWRRQWQGRRKRG
ncbi:GNAT family N-acetyltransferase [Streptomyces sp. NPDC059743]|uniref:GNAT family N-acetyltransferase n=1 Tax=Streptomyces sp. NPDC059743 TaxID=3346928 RepID=UPI003662B62C